jgi:hypothetical protein
VGGFTDYTLIPINVGDKVNVLDGDGTQLGLWTITGVTPATITATSDVSAPVVVQTNAFHIELGPYLRRIQVTAINPYLACSTLQTLSIVDDQGVATSGANTIGIPPGATSRSRLQTSTDIATAINTGSTLALAGAQFISSVQGLKGRSSNTQRGQITIYRIAETVTTSFAAGSVTAFFSGAQSAGVIAGDILVERNGDFPGTTYTVVSASDTEVVATLTSGTGSSQAGVQMEIGPNLGLSYYDLIEVTSGPNQGKYYITSFSGIDYVCQQNLALNADPVTGQNMLFTVSAGKEALTLSSVKTDTTSFIKVRGSAVSNFYTPTETGYIGIAGTTTFFQLPQAPTGLDIGDLVQFFAVSYNTPSDIKVVKSIEGTILTLDAPIPSNVSWNFSTSITPPFARLHTGHVFDFNSFQQELQYWAGLHEQQPLFFTNLNALINPLIANTTPTAEEVGAATNMVGELYKELNAFGAKTYGGTPSLALDAILSSYSTAPQAPVDALLRSFREKGADRAVDAITSGHFQLFFGMTPQTSSYAGQMQNAMQAVAMNDLPMKKMNRKDVATSRLLSSTSSPDPDYNLSDIEQNVPDPKGVGEF